MTGLPDYAAILVAAGLSSRFGRADKLTAELCGAPLLSWSLRALSDANPSQCIIVTGPQTSETLSSLPLDVTVVQNPDPAAGLGTSIALGARVVGANVRGVFICLADMPLISGALFHRLANSLDSDAELDAVAPVYNGRRGHPVLFNARQLAALNGLTGDSGAQSILKRPGFLLKLLETEDPAVVTDVDTPEDLERLGRLIAKTHPPEG